MRSIIFASCKTRSASIRRQQMDDSLDIPRALAVVASVLERGRVTHVGDWRELPASFHIDRARRHLDLLAQGDTSEPHLAHAATRLLMALEISQRTAQAESRPAGISSHRCE